MKRLLALTAAALAVMTLLCACGNNDGGNIQPPLASNSVIVADDSIPEGISPDITGVVTGISEVREGIVILVEFPDSKSKYAENSVYVTLTSRTIVESADKIRCESFREINPGDTVSVWFTGISTGTTPGYAVAQGIRVTAKVDELMMTVSYGGNRIMASPAGGEVTSSDIRPVLYGSYLITDGSGSLFLGFAKEPAGISASAVSAVSGETIFLADAAKTNELELPGTLTTGDYTVTVKVDYEDRTDFFMFTLSVR